MHRLESSHWLDRWLNTYSPVICPTRQRLGGLYQHRTLGDSIKQSGARSQGQAQRQTDLLRFIWGVRKHLAVGRFMLDLPNPGFIWGEELKSQMSVDWSHQSRTYTLADSQPASRPTFLTCIGVMYTHTDIASFSLIMLFMFSQEEPLTLYGHGVQ